MFNQLTPGFSTEYLVRAADNYDLHDRETRPLFVALTIISFMKKVQEEEPGELKACEDIWEQACAGNTLFVGEKGDTLTTFLFGTEQCLILTYALDSQNTKWELLSDGHTSLGNISVFLMGQFKEQGIIKRYLRVAPDQSNEIYRSLKSAIEKQQEQEGIRVFSFENWKLVYGNYPFNNVLLTQLESCDGEEVIPAGNSLSGNQQFMLKSRRPMTSFSIVATRLEDENDFENEDIQGNNALIGMMLATQMDIMLPVPYTFSTPALLLTSDTLSFAMVSPSSEIQGAFTIESYEEYPYAGNLQKFFNEFHKDRRLFANGLVDYDETQQVYLLNLDQLRRYTNVLVAPQHRQGKCINEDNAERYFSFLNGFTDEYEMERTKSQYEDECLSILSAIGNEEFALQQDVEERRREEEKKRAEEERRRQEEARKKHEEQAKAQSGTLRLVNTFHTKVAGVTYSNSGANSESRQRIIRDLLRSGQLDRGQELKLVQEPTNPYDNHAVAVFGPDGRQLGYLAREVARNVFNDMNRGNIYKAFVSDVTGGSVDMVYGINVRVESYKREAPAAYSPSSASYKPASASYDPLPASSYNQPTFSPYRSSTSYSRDFDYSDYEDINDIARSSGFSIDDDGHWVPLDDDY